MILRRYLAVRILRISLGLTLLLWLIMFARRFGQYVGDVVAGNLGAESLALLILLRTPDTLALLLPLALFLGLLLSCGQLYRNREILVMHGAGLSRARLLAWVLWPLLGGAALVALLSLWLAPWSIGQARQLWEEERTRRTTMAPVGGGLRTAQDGAMMIYARRRGAAAAESDATSEGEQLRDIFFARRSCADCPRPHWRFLSAPQGRLERDGRRTRLILQQGYRYEGAPPALDWRIVRFEHWQQYLPALLPRRSSKLSGLSMRQLWQAGGVREQAELQWRIALVLLALIPAPLALALAGWGGPRERYGGILAALGGYFGYLLCLISVRAAMDAGALAPLPGLWGVHALFAILGVLLLGRIPWRRSPVARGAAEDAPRV